MVFSCKIFMFKEDEGSGGERVGEDVSANETIFLSVKVETF